MLDLEFIRQYAKEHGLPLNLKNLITEYLQTLILEIIAHSPYNKDISFMGGTSLRFIYQTPRFSEDLDFDLLNKKHFNLKKLSQILKKELTLLGFSLSIIFKESKNLLRISNRFKNILYQVGLTSDKQEKFNINIEIDKNPPLNIKTRLHIVNHFNKLFPILVNDKQTLFAEKLLALLLRRYTKGRDFYDLIFFLSDPTNEPNYQILKEKKLKISNKKDLVRTLEKKIEKVNTKKVISDIRSFIFSEKQLEMIKNYSQIFSDLKKKYLRE